MPALPHPPFLCVITDDNLSAEPIVAAIDAACAAGRIVVQLRARDRSGRELFELAQKLRKATAARGSLLVVNDRLDVALAVRADGVHLPGTGIPPSAARSLLADRARAGGDRMLLGLSVHSVDEIRAHAAHVDYFQFGPVFATPSKAMYGPPQGLTALADAVAASTALQRGVVAVGGIDADNVAETARTGVAGVAVIRAVMRATDSGAAARALIDSINRTRA